MKASRIARVVLVAAALLILGAGAYLGRVASPSYETKHFSDEVVEFEYPTVWSPPTWRFDSHGFGSLATGPDASDNGLPPPFDTRWDKNRAVIMLAAWPAKLLPDPRQRLLDELDSAKKGLTGNLIKADTKIETITIGGRQAMRLTTPGADERLDIGPFRTSLYDTVFEGMGQWTSIMVPTKNGAIQIKYFLPEDKIAYRRYQKVFGRIVDSLKVKSS